MDVREQHPLHVVGLVVDDGDEVDVAPRGVEVGEGDRAEEIDPGDEAWDGRLEVVEVVLDDARDDVGDVDGQRVHGAALRHAGHGHEGRCDGTDFRRDTAGGG